MNIRKIKHGKHSKQFSKSKNNSFRNRNKLLSLTINIASKLFLLFVFIFIYKVIFKENITINNTSINYTNNNDNSNKNDYISKLGIEKIHFDEFEVDRYNEIKNILIEKPCSAMWANQREFLNGVVRKLKPKKILEIGVEKGGSAIIILNAIKDIDNSKLYSIDLNSDENEVGKCVKNYFPEFMKNWELFIGNFASEFMEKIGNNIDMAFIDTSHLEPGEILDFLIALPFLKKNAVVVFHDIAIQITHNQGRDEWAPYIIFNALRGKKFLPSGNNILTQDIGAIILDDNQERYYQDYFRLLGGQWQYFPKEIYIDSVRNLFKKYYDKDCLTIFEEAVNFNRGFVKRYPKFQFYKYNSE